MTDLANFVIARIVFDEKVAVAAAASIPMTPPMEQHWHVSDRDSLLVEVLASWGPVPIARAHAYVAQAQHIAMHDPPRVLAECRAKRKIGARAVADGDEDTLKLLALPYADHPQYREDWKP